MLPSTWVISALCTTTFSAPTFPSSVVGRPVVREVLSEYFQIVGEKVQAERNMAQAPLCNMNTAMMPASPITLPPPSAGLTLKHVAIGRGTQNYSCGANETATPVALGAVATLYNASCVASTYPDLLSMLPKVALQFNLTDIDQVTLLPFNLAISGHHYFANLTTPTFNLDTAAMDLGFAPCVRNNSVTAPVGASVGQDDEGFGPVPWLKLLTRNGATGGLKEVYRVNVAGGRSPATCVGMPTTFKVQYAAEYWFYES
ncbi:uncharacterized protein PAC_16779 [Phialocephala subalpina]|uniref:Malate dehydrogenase n=1 Tax=Phialocephala subalpina TaxID=576137 RepID=A0A1L7XPC7_9HELO|nr:uncharacterized protein PAC_16779 [Phialocephala subalpina]